MEKNKRGRPEGATPYEYTHGHDAGLGSRAAGAVRALQRFIGAARGRSWSYWVQWGYTNRAPPLSRAAGAAEVPPHQG